MTEPNFVTTSGRCVEIAANCGMIAGSFVTIGMDIAGSRGTDRLVRATYPAAQEYGGRMARSGKHKAQALCFFAYDALLSWGPCPKVASAYAGFESMEDKSAIEMK